MPPRAIGRLVTPPARQATTDGGTHAPSSFDRPDGQPTAYQRLLVPDLEAAEIDPGADGDPVVDFHSFRHAYVTRLVRAGVPIKVTQQPARHSSPVLTMNVYAHLGLADERAGLDRAFGAGAGAAVQSKMVGTSGAPKPARMLAPRDPRKPPETPGIVA